jgi:hypothetical protein
MTRSDQVLLGTRWTITDANHSLSHVFAMPKTVPDVLNQFSEAE